MCTVSQQPTPTATMAAVAGEPHRAGIKRRALAAGGEDCLRGRKRARAAGAGAGAGALVPYVPVAAPIDARPIKAVPLAVVAPPTPVVGGVPEDPSWIRKILFCRLGLRYDLPVVFIEEKTVTRTDLDPHQNRFRLACGGVESRLLPLLTHEEAVAASFVQQQEEEEGASATPSPSPPRPSPPPPRPDENTAGVVVVAAADQAEQLQQGQAQPPETKIRKKRKGRDHGGLPVTLVHLRGGIKQLLLTRWDSSGAAIIKGEGYLDFIARCGLMEKDVVHVWAFKQREFRIFGATYPEKPLYMVIASAPRRAAAPPPPLPMPMPMPMPPTPPAAQPLALTN